MIEFRNIAIERGGNILLSDVNSRIEDRSKTVVIGPSGCGKTSLLLAVMGMYQPAEGEIRFKNEPVTIDTLHDVRRSIAYISQEPILGTETVQNAISLPFTFKANRDNTPTRERIEATLKKLHLSSEILGKRCAKISAGEKQRIAISRAILMDKSVFLVDEATSALDPESKAAVIDLLLGDNFTVLSVSHDDYWIQRCGNVLMVKDGTIVKRGGNGDN